MKTILDYLTKPRDNYIDYIGAVGLGALSANGMFWRALVFYIVASVVADLARYWFEKAYSYDA